MRKLNQVLAAEKSIKARTYAAITEMHKAAQVPALFNGHSKTYEPLKEDGLPQPTQTQKVQRNAEEMFAEVQKSMSELFDVYATKDWGNQKAKSDLVVDGQILIKDAPATYLLFLDKQLSDLLTFVGKMTELDGATDWTKDPNTGLFRSDSVQTFTTQKVQRALVMYQATEHHPAQTQLITEDQVVGRWSTVKQSGAVPAPRKKRLMERIQKVLDAAKHALENANSTVVEEQSTGAAVLGYIFAD